MLNRKVIVLASAFTFVLAAPSRSDLYNYQPLVAFPCGEEVDKWVSTVGIGSPAQNFDLLIDTTTAETWVAGVKCKSEFCVKQPGELYNAGKSTTSVDQHTNITLQYDELDGSTVTVAGSLYTDSFTYTGGSYPHVLFGKAFDVEGWEDESGFAGYLGLAPSESTSSKKREYGGGTAIGLVAILATLPFKRNNLQCVLGVGIDQNAVVGDFTWFAPPSCDFKGTKSWKTDLSCFQIKDVIDFKLKDSIASFDTSAYGIQVPKKHLDEIYKSLKATYNEQDKTYEFKCCYANDLKFTLDGYNVVIPVNAWTTQKGSDGEYCTAKFEETPATYDDNQWNLGQTFFRNFYSIYDPVEQRTGLALTHSSFNGSSITSA